MATETNKLSWHVRNELDEAMHEITHIQTTRAMISSVIEEIEEWHYKGDTRLVFELNRQSLDTLLHMQHKMIDELAATLQELRQYDPSNDTDDADVWENRSIPTIDIDAMDRARAQEQHSNSGQQK